MCKVQTQMHGLALLHTHIQLSLFYCFVYSLCGTLR